MHYISCMADSVPVQVDDSGFHQGIQLMLEEYGDENFCRSLIEVFIRDGTKALGQLRKSVDSGDMVKAYASAHSLKNMLGVLRSQKGVELAELSCTQLQEGSTGSSIEELLGLTTSFLQYSRALVANSRTL